MRCENGIKADDTSRRSQKSFSGQRKFKAKAIITGSVTTRAWMGRDGVETWDLLRAVGILFFFFFLVSAPCRNLSRSTLLYITRTRIGIEILLFIMQLRDKLHEALLQSDTYRHQ